MFFGNLLTYFTASQGEAVIITRSKVSRRQLVTAETFSPDIFEYVYFARPDSVLDGISVYRSRMAMGDLLADEVKRVLKEKQLSVDVVIPVGWSISPLRSVRLNLRFSGPRYITRRCTESCSEASASIPRRLH